MRRFLAAGLALVATACVSSTGVGIGLLHRGRHAHPRSSPASAAHIVIEPSDGARKVRAGEGIRIRVGDGTITGLRVRTSGGVPVPGAFDATRASWHSLWALSVDTRYVAEAWAVDAFGRPTVAKSAFRTLAPERTFSTRIFEGLHETYGVGMPIMLQFSEPIAFKKRVERSLELTTSKRVVGAWSWDGDQTLYFRPRDYWPPHTRVRFVGHLDGVEGAPGVWGYHTLTQSFRIGRSLIADGNTKTHHISIYLDHKLIGNWPMSSGRPGDDTPNGTYLTIDKSNPEHMVGPGYSLDVPWSVRFTWSGDFLHDAYWSVNQQGFENVSHGCVNLSPANAERYYKLAVPGDPVTIAGSPRGGRWDNGWTMWFRSWKQLWKGSALELAVEASRDGTTWVRPGSVPPSDARAPLRRPRSHNAGSAA